MAIWVEVELWAKSATSLGVSDLTPVSVVCARASVDSCSGLALCIDSSGGLFLLVIGGSE